MFASCATSKYQVITSVLDYSTVSENKDFFITESNSVSFNYKAIGSITVECISGNHGTTIIDNSYETSNYKFASVEDAYKELVKTFISKGANGVINLQSRYISAYSTKYTFYDSRWIVSGMMIIK